MLLLALLFFQTIAFAQEPSINLPRLSYLDTNSGLDQNTIEDIYVDSQGFVWIGTGEGLNRFDGVKTMKIHGSSNELSNNAVYKIFEHSSGLFFLSTDNSGVVSFNRNTHSVKPIIDLPTRFSDDWQQYSESIIELSSGNLLIALSEGIYEYDLTSKNIRNLHTLSDKDVVDGVAIRALYEINGHILFGTWTGLYAINTKSNLVKPILHSNDLADQSNVKSLASFDKQSLYVGTVKGLYKFAVNEVIDFIENNTESPEYIVLDENRNIWDIASKNGSEVYFASDIGLFEYNEQKDQFRYLFETKKNFEVISRPDITNLSFDNNSNLWFGTKMSGAMMWSPNSVLFTNVYHSVFSKDKSTLSHNAVWSIFQYDKNTLFVGTSNGLNKYDLQTKDTQQYLVQASLGADNTESQIYQIFSTERGYLWLITNDGLRYFDINQGRNVPLPFSNEKALGVLNEWSYSAVFEGTNKIWTITDSGIYVVDRESQKTVRIDSQAYGLSLTNVFRFLGIDKPSNTLLISVSSQLWGINLDDYSLSLMHSIKHEASNDSLSPGSFVRDDNNTIWLSYPGHAIFKLEGNSLSLIDKLSTQNILPTNLVYDLRFDNEGELWFSSHSGIHSLNPQNLIVKSYGYLNGLAATEFNQFASEILSDGRFAYGANVGFTIFDPSKIKLSDMADYNRAHITEFTLSNRKLRLPLTDLNDMEIELEHDDIGLTLYYSSLNFDKESNKRFHYSINSDGDIVNYPNFRANEISLARLPPGKHTLEIYRVGQLNNESPARLFLHVNYAPFQSPKAYAAYFVFCLISLIIFLYRRRKVQQNLAYANQQVKEYNKRLTDALIASNSNIWEWHEQTNDFRCERISTDILPELNTDTLPLEKYIELIHEDDRQHFIDTWQKFISKQDQEFDLSYRVSNQNGIFLWYRDVGSVTTSKENGLVVKGTYSNLTDKRANEEKLKLFGNAFKHTRDWVLIFDRNLKIVATNPAFMKAFNVNRKQEYAINTVPSEYQELLHHTSIKLKALRPGQNQKLEMSVKLQKRNVNVLCDLNAIADKTNPKETDYYLIIGTDITEQISAQEKLQKLANYDVLTGLLNRTLLLERIKQSISFAKRHKHQLAILFIDLDGFKPINDSFGHLAGDSVLVDLAARIKAQFREEDSVARLGGDEFVVVLEEVGSANAVNETVNKLLTVIAQPFVIRQQRISVSASVGIAFYPHDASEPESLITNADIAMYEAKANGKNKFQYYRPDMNEQVQSRTILLNKVKAAAQANEFVNNYQAIVNGISGENAGFELLLRWHDAEEAISPAVFIPLAEQAGCIVDITMQAIERAISDIANWFKEGFTGYVAINLSAWHFDSRPDFETILNHLAIHKLPSSCLRFEITEGIFIDNSEHVIAYLHEMRSFGFQISLDDFGTGYSSLKYIKDFPLDLIKIDKSFVEDVTTNKGTESIVQTTLLMTSLLGLDTIAEGVETKAQFDYFVSKGCQFIQGFYFTKALPAEEIPKILHKNWLIDNNNQNNT
ncbi:EAL domain-containing protein [Glaciecola sp. 2405UD65-10]|uniref:EAL domain-containing protein n=1 Tax=Glaciecola sp. 2405UD65-10 TaxID=3397244 RepID=UPI003B5BF00A